MDLDEMKSRARSVRAPMPASSSAGRSEQSDTDLIGRMKAIDAKDVATLRRFTLLFVIAGIFCGALFTLTWFFPPDNDPNIHRVLLSCMALLFLSFGAMHRSKSRELSGIDYTKPVLSFLNDSEKRYRLLGSQFPGFKILYFLALLALLGASLGSWIMAMHRYFPELDDSTAILIFCALIAVSAVLGATVGLRDWKKRKAPILEELRRMKEELMRDETSEGTAR